LTPSRTQLNDTQHFGGVLALLEALLGASTALPSLTPPSRPPLPKGVLDARKLCSAIAALQVSVREAWELHDSRPRGIHSWCW
jgi:hypothetical protein